MSLPIYDKDEAFAAVKEASSRFAALLRSANDPTRTAIGKWSVAEVATHASHIYQMYPGLVAGESSPIEDHLNMSPFWDKLLAEDPERDLKVIADRIQSSADRFVAAADSAEWTQLVNWHGGVKIPVYSLAAILTNEADLHGLDVASAEGRSWTVPADHARIVITGHFPLLPNFVNKEAADFGAVYELRVRGGDRVFVTVDHGSIDIDKQRPAPVDCRISADPVQYVLVGYGRKSQWGPILMGKIASWGKKPWLSMRFAKLFHAV
ncbi:MAG: maleylpyruvate isomerase N-terminal domain-containing protein [Actinomycetota bacterium]